MRSLVKTVRQLARVVLRNAGRSTESEADQGDAVMRYVIESVQLLLDQFPEPIRCIETGTIRSYHEKHESTRHIAEALQHRGSLVSVDMSEESIRISKDVCRNVSARYDNIEWVRANSLDYLRDASDLRFHFALLDSLNDKDLIFEEFRLVVPLLVEDGIIMVDDAGISPDGTQIDSDVTAQKGHRVWSFLHEVGASFEVLTTSHRHGTQLRIPLTSENRTLFESELKET